MAKSNSAVAPVEDEISQPEYVVPKGELTLTLTEAEVNKPGFKPGTKSVLLFLQVQDDVWATKDENGDVALDEDGEEARPMIRALVSQTLGVSKAAGPSNLRRAVTALLGRDLTTDSDGKPEKVRLSELYGTSFKATVLADKKLDGRVFPKIVWTSAEAIK